MTAQGITSKLGARSHHPGSQNQAVSPLAPRTALCKAIIVRSFSYVQYEGGTEGLESSATATDSSIVVHRELFFTSDITRNCVAVDRR